METIIKQTFKKIGAVILKSKVKVIAITFIVCLAAATIYAAAANSYSVKILVDNGEINITTLREDAADILKQANVEINKGDVVDLSDFSSGSKSTITVYRACIITVYDNSDSGVKYPAVGSVERSLSENGIALNDGDELSCNREDIVREGMEVVISRAFPVTVVADGETYKLNMASGTVADALNKAVVTIDDDDIISASLDTALTSGMTIKVTRVEYKERTADEVLPFTTQKKNNANLYTDQTKTIRKGVNGRQNVTYKDKYVNGKLVESVKIKSVVTKAATERILEVGTKRRPTVSANGIYTVSTLSAPSSLQIGKNGVPTSYKRVITGTASAYSGGGVTATGKYVRPGYIAVNPNQIPYGTKMWIVSNDGSYVYGYASAEDTGGFIYWSGSSSTVCDLYFDSEGQASAFGRRGVTIYIL